MKITLKLYASLAKYLPRNAKRNEVIITVGTGISLQGILELHSVPIEQCHLVLVNGIYIAPSERQTYVFAEMDTLAVWPPVAGG